MCAGLNYESQFSGVGAVFGGCGEINKPFLAFWVFLNRLLQN
jgi:hypothetical protein